MVNIRPTGDILGATITGIDLSRPMSEADFSAVLQALGEYGVLRFPDQLLEPAALRDFSLRFGSIQASVTGKFQDPQVPEVGILSNIVEDGKPIGIADAGQDWHTDMSYRDTMGFVNVLNAHKVPRRDGKPLGNTLFANMRAAASSRFVLRSLRPEFGPNIPQSALQCALVRHLAALADEPCLDVPDKRSIGFRDAVKINAFKRYELGAFPVIAMLGAAIFCGLRAHYDIAQRLLDGRVSHEFRVAHADLVPDDRVAALVFALADQAPVVAVFRR